MAYAAAGLCSTVLRTSPASAPGFRHKLLAALIAAQLTASAHADDLFALSLDELLEIEVTSVSGRAASVLDSAAAVYVITADEIRRSGVTTIPEALRLAPGMEVAQIDGNKWAISARGYNQRFSNKLLVLVDGRAVYNQIFSGVFWDVQDTVLEDIERIEVVRGPGATLWGANAVNGVINIITRPAADTQGAMVTALAGDQEAATVSARWGGEVSDFGAYRVYAKQFDRDANRVADGDFGGDHSDQWRLGGRVDLDPDDRNSFTFSAESYEGDSGETAWNFSFEEPYRWLDEREQAVSGFHALARWSHTLSATEDFRLQAFIDHADRDWSLAQIDRETMDVAFDFRSTRFAAHDLLAGAGYRRYDDRIRPGFSQRATMLPEERTEEVLSFFIQDEIQFPERDWRLTLGSKFEYNDFVGLQIQPSARLMYRPTSTTSWWASVSRAVRTPGRADRDVFLLYDIYAGMPGFPPSVAFALGSQDFDSEILVAYEAGFKFQPGDDLSIDLAVYRNRYDRTRSTTVNDPVCIPSFEPLPGCLATPGVEALGILTTQNNAAQSDTAGLEIATAWKPQEDWLINANYSYLTGKETSDEMNFFSDNTLVTSPAHQASLRVGYSPDANWEFDVWLRYVGSTAAFDGTKIPDYATADLRIGRSLGSRASIALVGKNVFEDARAQFLSEPVDVPLTEIRRSVFLQLQFSF